MSSTYSGASAAIDHNGYVKGNLFYMANYTAGVRVMDITNISAATNSMSEVGYFDTYPANNNTAFNGVWSVYPYFASGNIIINDIERGLFIVRKSGTLGIENQNLKNSFDMFPNPSSQKTTITTSNNEVINTIEVFSILGQKVLVKDNINEPKYVLNTFSLHKGVYFVKINNSLTKKLIIN